MGKCVNHPDRETSYLCMKHNAYLCEECLKCRDPNIYCKFRSSCPIWFLSKRKEGLDAEEKTLKSASGIKHSVTFLPDDKEIMVPEGMTLLDADVSAGFAPGRESQRGA
ncbi:MAG: hypothetical protein R6V76_00750 [Desulfobacterales bacterium]